MPTKRIVTVAALCAVALLATPSGSAAERIVFGTDWRAQAEHGGFYQALATAPVSSPT